MSTATSKSQTYSYDTLIPQLLPPFTPAPLLQPPSPPKTQAPRATHPKLTASIAALQLHPCMEALLHILNSDLASAHFLVRHMEAPPRYEAMLLHAVLHRVEGDIENARAWYGDVAGSGVFEFVWREGKEESRAEGDVVRKVEEAKEREKRFAADAEQQGIEIAKQGSGVNEADINATPSDGNANLNDQDQLEPGSDAAKRASSTLPHAISFLDRVRALQRSHHKQKGHTEWQAEHAALSTLSERETRRLLKWCETRFGTHTLLDASSEFPRKAGKFAEMAKSQLVGGEGWRQF